MLNQIKATMSKPEFAKKVRDVVIVVVILGGMAIAMKIAADGIVERETMFAEMEAKENQS